jgi:hypothetical protein
LTAETQTFNQQCKIENNQIYVDKLKNDLNKPVQTKPLTTTKNQIVKIMTKEDIERRRQEKLLKEQMKIETMKLQEERLKAEQERIKKEKEKQKLVVDYI